MRRPRLAAATASAFLAGPLLLGLAACGDSGDSNGGSGGSAAAAAPATPAASASPAPQAAIAALTGSDTAVAVDPAVLTALKSLGVAVAPTGTGKLTQQYGPTLDFPITGGAVKIFDRTQVTPYVQGHIEHQGSGLRFSAGTKTLTVQNFTVDPGTSMLNAEVVEMGNAKVPLFHLDGTNLKISKDSAGRAKLDGTQVQLTDTAAGALNKTFGVTAFTDRMPIGIAHITAD
ncbi:MULTISPECIES: hypothetical protein [Frankia]|uniref:Lipoprotein n=1 Tax=Frankia alni (strain DSM 45986 / CECT 9034 / ACN14a) TaxID=326424 RepID=Q0RJN9_FRAAA|nr:MULTISPECIES: hypothetical protein [Frankia]CAJ62273.1 hypothetical protein; putative signal peptide [Frankia alni ACN14a]